MTSIASAASPSSLVPSPHYYPSQSTSQPQSNRSDPSFSSAGYVPFTNQKNDRYQQQSGYFPPPLLTPPIPSGSTGKPSTTPGSPIIAVNHYSVPHHLRTSPTSNGVSSSVPAQNQPLDLWSIGGTDSSVEQSTTQQPLSRNSPVTFLPGPGATRGAATGTGNSLIGVISSGNSSASIVATTSNVNGTWNLNATPVVTKNRSPATGTSVGGLGSGLVVKGAGESGGTLGSSTASRSTSPSSVAANLSPSKPSAGIGSGGGPAGQGEVRRSNTTLRKLRETVAAANGSGSGVTTNSAGSNGRVSPYPPAPSLASRSPTFSTSEGFVAASGSSTTAGRSVATTTRQNTNASTRSTKSALSVSTTASSSVGPSLQRSPGHTSGFRVTNFSDGEGPSASAASGGRLQTQQQQQAAARSNSSGSVGAGSSRSSFGTGLVGSNGTGTEDQQETAAAAFPQQLQRNLSNKTTDSLSSGVLDWVPSPGLPPTSSSAIVGGGTVPNGGKMNSSSNGPSGQQTAAVLASTSGSQRKRARPDTEEIKRTGRMHYEELYKFLKSHLAKAEMGGPRSNARDKLTRLSKQQFAELSTDVYDELMRRLNNAKYGSDSPHLAVRDEFHPKRNQARQKLATLPKTRFKDLGSDVFFELERRFPELKEEYRPEAAARDRAAASAAAQAQVGAQTKAQTLVMEQEAQADVDAKSAMAQQDRAAADASRSRLQQDLKAMPSTEEEIIPAKSTLVEEKITVPYQSSSSTGNKSSGGTSSVPAGKRGILERSGSKESGGDLGGEDEDDYRDSIGSGVNGKIGGLSGLVGAISRKNSKDDASAAAAAIEREYGAERESRMSTTSSVGTGFLNGYAASTVASGASPQINRASQFEGPSPAIDKIRSDYEFRLATLNQRVATLEAQNSTIREELDDVQTRAHEKDAIIGELRESHARSATEVREEHRSQIDAKHSELEEVMDRLGKLREEHVGLQRQMTDKASADAPALQQLRAERDALQSEYAQQEEVVQELQGQVSTLMEELKELSSRNDEMLAENDNHTAVIRDLNQQVQSYKRKYENAKSELRTLKATSQLYVKPPKADDFMPASDKGAIADVHLTAFQSSIDELLAAARSKTPSNVLLAMKSVVLATTLVTDDVAKSEQNGLTDLSEEDEEQLLTLKSKTSATLNNLMTACRNHASSHGMSPVSLLDAAASHVSTTIVDLVKLLKVRKASKSESEQLEATFTQDGTRTLQNGLKPLHIGGSSLKASSANGPNDPPSPSTSERKDSTRGRSDKFSNGPVDDRFSPRTRQPSTFGRYSPVGYRADVTRKDSIGEGSWKNGNGSKVSRANSLSSASSTRAGVPAVPTIRPEMLGASGQNGSGRTTPDQHLNGGSRMGTSSSPSQALVSSDSGGEENWAELRGYIETQTKEIFNSISALLSAIREGAQGVQLRENLTQIVTIVSSIVAISKDNLPESARKEGGRILADLTENCDKLGEMQGLSTFDKTTKTNMASASYGVAKGLKALEGLLNDAEDEDGIEDLVR